HILEIAPGAYNVLLRRGNVWRDMEQLDKAEADYARVIELLPNDARGWRNRGLIRLMKGDTKTAVADYDKAITFDLNDAISLNNRGFAKRKLGNTKGAIEDFRAALKLQPGLETTTPALRELGAEP